MEIHKLTATFGKLSRQSMEFTDGLNVVRAPNEAGKSTWCAFIRAMLYGVDSAERARAGYLPDKVRYAPWSGEAMEGEMTLTAGGRDITLTRLTKTRTGPMREFSAVYAGTNVPVPGLDGGGAGEALTGVSREVFRRSAFVEQGGLTVTGSPELEKRIAAIVTTGEEGMSYSEADTRLRAWQRKRRFNRRGAIPELEEAISEAKRGAESLDAAAARREELRGQLTAADARCARLETAVAEGRKQCRREALDNLTRSRGQLTRLADGYNEAYTRARADRAALEHCALGDRTPDEARAQCAREKAESLALKAAAGIRISHAGAFACLAVMLLAVLALIVLGLGSAAVLAACLAAALGGAAGTILCWRGDRRKSTAAAEKARARGALLARYGAADEAGIDTALEEFLGLYAAAEASAQTAAAARKRLDEAQAGQSALETATLSDLDFANGGTEAARLGRELDEARRDRERLAAEFARLEGGLQALGDPVVQRSGIAAMEEERDELQKEYDAISLAVDTLREADGELQRRFSPELGRKAAEYMAAMTGGRYDVLLLNRDFTARAGTAGNGPAREAEYLSAGTLDLLYLAVRLAVCALALPEGEKCPLILDDPLVNFDPLREKQAMTLLAKLAGERQVILFTCKGANI